MSRPTITKACPNCGHDLAIRTNSKNNSAFLGCTAYPDCKYTEAVPETLRMRALGAPELPMFDEQEPTPPPNPNGPGPINPPVPPSGRYDDTDLIPAFIEWQEGNISTTEALRELLTLQASIDAELAVINTERDQLRDAIGHIVATMDGQKATVGGYTMAFTSPSVVTAYDKKKVQALLNRMTAEASEYAIDLAQCQTQSERAGTLRITKDKVAK